MTNFRNSNYQRSRVLNMVRGMLRNPNQFSHKELTRIFDQEVSRIRSIDLLLEFSELSVLCDKCGKCCRESSPILLDVEDISRIASYLGMSFINFSLQYVTANGEEFSFKKDRPCAFLDSNNLCSIYPDRPYVCMGYPMNTYQADISDDGAISGSVVMEHDEFCQIPDRFLAQRIVVELLKNRMPDSLVSQLKEIGGSIYEKAKAEHPNATEFELDRFILTSLQRKIMKRD